jgi:hypothetical protein
MTKAFAIAITCTTQRAFAEKIHLMRRALHNLQVLTVITLLAVYQASALFQSNFIFFHFHKKKVGNFLKIFNCKLAFSLFFFCIHYLEVRKTARGNNFGKLILPPVDASAETVTQDVFCQTLGHGACFSELIIFFFF